MTNKKIALVFSSAFIFLTSAFGVLLSASNVFAQETTTTDGNITGGGVNVPLNDTNSDTTPESNVTTSSTDSNVTNQQASTTTASLTPHPFSINTDMMRPVLYLIDPVSDTIITVDLSKNPKYPTGSMPLHTVITPDGKKAFLSTMSSDTSPATILALDINNIDWQAGKADVAITNVIKIAEPNTKPPTPTVQNRTDNDTQPIIAKMWFPNNIQIHGPSLHPTSKFAYFTDWTNNTIRVLDVSKGTLAESDPIQYGDKTQWLHGVFFNPSGDKALAPHYFFDGNHLVSFDVNKETGQFSNPVEVILGTESQYAAFPHFVTWMNDTSAITSTQQIGPTSITPDNAKIIGPSVWLINTNKIEPNKDNKTESAATMIIAPTQSPDGNGIYQPASDTTIVNTKLYVAEEDSMDKEINNNGHVSIWDISDTTKPQLINRLSPGKGLPENFQLGHTIYSTPDNKFVYVEDWNSGQLVKLDTATDKVIKVFNKENIGFEMPHGGFITGKYR
jgi:hypothetical protein